MRILFTAIGGSDPIKRMMDGPMLHCCRIYRPDIVYMYLTKKMLEYENEDGRYSWTINKLGESIGHKFEIIKIERPELVEAQRFDMFYIDFEEIISKIRTDHPKAEIYLNASSGTPAIKGAFVTIAAMTEKKINVIQVSSGESRPLNDRENDDTYNKEEFWECDLDNEDAKDRTSLVMNMNLAVKLKKQSIRNMIKAYDYDAAYKMIHDISDHLNKDVIDLIAAAKARLGLDRKKCIDKLAGTEYDILPHAADNEIEVIEYLLWLDIVRKKGDYLSFIRGITPVAMALMEKAVENLTPIGNILDYCVDKKGHNILSSALMVRTETGIKMLEILNRQYKTGGYLDREYTTAQLEPLICGFCDDVDIKRYVSIIREAEQKIRNPAAHTIVAVDDDFISERIGITAAGLYHNIKSLAIGIGIADKKMWESYNKMNELILELVGE